MADGLYLAGRRQLRRSERPAAERLVRWAANFVKWFHAAIVILGFSACAERLVARAEQLEEVSHHGVLHFRVPADWSVELREEGGGVYWDPSGASGILRLDLLTFQRNVEITEQSALEVVSRPERPGSRIAKLENGNALREYEQSTEQEGEPLHMWFWELASVVPPNHFRLAIFSYTVAAPEAALPETLHTVDLLRSEITSSRFAPELGVVPP